jgi:uncharacterized protein with NRDE domain
MCTLIALHRSVPGFPLIVAANRDEYFDRPSEGLALRRGSEGWMVAPLDERAGGTWLGLSGPRKRRRDGGWVFAALTNLRTANPDPACKSRGQVVMQALEAASASEAADTLSKLSESAYNPFNCFVADAEQAFLVVYDGSPRAHELSPGVHVIGNEDAAALSWSKELSWSQESSLPQETPRKTETGKASRVAREVLRSVALTREPRLEALAQVARAHGSRDAGGRESDGKEATEKGDPLNDTCVHLGGTYGTRSSLLLELSEKVEQSRMYCTEGPPCVNEYQDVSSLLHELRQAPGYGAAEILERNAS